MYLALESGLPSFIPDFTCPVLLRIPLRAGYIFTYRTFTFFGRPFQAVQLMFRLITLLTRSYNPYVQAHRFGLFRFRSPLLSESLLISFPPGTEMFHFPGLPSCVITTLDFTIQHRKGLPHSEIAGSKVVCTSPTLIAAYHVLHRQSRPRHSPYALSSLATFLNPPFFIRASTLTSRN